MKEDRGSAVLNKQVAQAILDQQDELAETITEYQYRQQPELDERYGGLSGREKTLQDTAYNLAFLAESIAMNSPALFADYITWLRIVLEKRHVLVDDLVKNLEFIQEILAKRLEPAERAITAEYLQAGLVQLPPEAVTSLSFIDEESPHGVLAARYLNILLHGSRHEARKLIMEAVSDGLPIRDIYLHVFQPVQYEIGRLWQVNEISVAQEHYATAVTQLVMAQLYPYIFAGERSGNILVAACVGNELHEIGVRMVADFFELAGWDTFYLGANTPAESIVQAVTQRRANLLAVSATMAMHVSRVVQLIEAVRSSPAGEVNILVGGYPFNVAPNLWQRVGADGYAAEAETAVAVAEELV